MNDDLLSKGLVVVRTNLYCTKTLILKNVRIDASRTFKK